MTQLLIALFIGGFLYWFFILRPGRLDFWKVAARNPHAAYDQLQVSFMLEGL